MYSCELLSHKWAKVGWPGRTYIQQLCANTGGSLEDLWEQWTIERGVERGSWRPMLPVWHDNFNTILLLICKVNPVLVYNRNNWHKVMWFQEFLSNTNNLYTIIYLQERRLKCEYFSMNWKFTVKADFKNKVYKPIKFLLIE